MKRKQVSECGVCRGSSEEERLLLHNVRHRGYYRRLCTACVLNNFPGSFCPICFEVYEELPPLQQRVMCFNCPSITHTACVACVVEQQQQQLPPHYQCVSCTNPNFAEIIINNKVADNKSVEIIRRKSLNSVSAKKLLAAAKIAHVLMSKSADAARADAERKVIEAALAKRKARQAMEHVAYLVHTQNHPNPPTPNAQDQVDKSQTPNAQGNNKYTTNGSSSPVSPL